MNTYGDRLDHALTLAKKDRVALGKELGISIQAIGQVIAGKTKALTAENSARAARFLDVDQIWLATGEGHPLAHRALGATGWPFPHLEPAEYEKLSDAQRAAIEDWVIGQVHSFLSPASLKRTGDAKSA